MACLIAYGVSPKSFIFLGIFYLVSKRQYLISWSLDSQVDSTSVLQQSPRNIKQPQRSTGETRRCWDVIKFEWPKVWNKRPHRLKVQGKLYLQPFSAEDILLLSFTPSPSLWVWTMRWIEMVYPSVWKRKSHFVIVPSAEGCHFELRCHSAIPRGVINPRLHPLLH